MAGIEPKQRWVITEGKPVRMEEGDIPKGAITLMEGRDLLPARMPDGWGVLPPELIQEERDLEEVEACE